MTAESSPAGGDGPPSSRQAVSWEAVIGRLTAFLASTRPPAVSEVAAAGRDPFQVLVSTMISLRTKDEVTTRAARRLLERAGDAEALAALEEEEIERLIYPAGFYRTKAGNLRAAARILLRQHGGRVPSSMAELLALPGVGRKTANLVRNLGYGLPGICVDTHVHRISNRLGWVRTRTPEQTETALERILPRRYWIPINELLVRFGQNICLPLRPKCGSCPIARHCPRLGVRR